MPPESPPETRPESPPESRSGTPSAGPARRRGDPAFAVRFGSAAVLAPAALLLAWAGGFAFGAAVGLTAILMIREWSRMSDPGARLRAWAPVGGLLLASALLGAGGLWAAALGVLALAAVVGALERFRRGLAWRAAFGALYVGLPCLVLVWARVAPDQGFLALVCLFAIVWSADVGAYLIGAWLGGPKLAPRVSPNKTWSGLIAGVALGGAAGAIGFSLLGLSPWIGASVGLLTAGAAMGGDLVESVLKRRFGVKDAGALIPGHGGVLDRVDALMGAVLMFAALIAYWPAAGAGFFGS